MSGTVKRDLLFSYPVIDICVTTQGCPNLALSHQLATEASKLVKDQIVVSTGLDAKGEPIWPQASKNSPKQLRASKKIPQLVLQGQ